MVSPAPNDPQANITAVLVTAEHVGPPTSCDSSQKRNRPWLLARIFAACYLMVLAALKVWSAFPQHKAQQPNGREGFGVEWQNPISGYRPSVRRHARCISGFTAQAQPCDNMLNR